MAQLVVGGNNMLQDSRTGQRCIRTRRMSRHGRDMCVRIVMNAGHPRAFWDGTSLYHLSKQRPDPDDSKEAEQNPVPETALSVDWLLFTTPSIVGICFLRLGGRQCWIRRRGTPAPAFEGGACGGHNIYKLLIKTTGIRDNGNLIRTEAE